MLSLYGPARAATHEDREDCNQHDDPRLQIRGCTSLIDSWSFLLDIPETANLPDSLEALAIAYNNRGNAYHRLGQYRRSIEDYDQALRINPSYAGAYDNRGEAYFQLGDHQRAIEDYDKALRLDPDDAKAYNNRAYSLYLLGRFTEALGDVEQSLSLEPDYVYAIATHAEVLAALERRTEALAEFERAMRIGGAEWVRMYQRALKGHGYYRGLIDGNYEPEIRAALAACLDAGCRVTE